MKHLKYPAFLGLALTIIPPALYLAGPLESFQTTKTLMLVGMIIWYAAATPWLAFQKEDLDSSTQDQI